MTSNSTPRVHVVAAVVCDDVRKEANGKDILIGVYSGTIAVHELPSPPVSLRCWIALSTSEAGRFNLKFRARNHSMKEIFQSSIGFTVQEKKEKGTGSISVGPILYSLTDPEGSLTIEYAEEKGSWTTIVEKRIEYQSAIR